MKARLNQPELERVAGAVLALAMIAASVVMLWFGRGTTFTIDELVWFTESPQLSLGDALEPHGGHLTLTSRLVYKVGLEIFGASYLPFRLLTVAAILLTVGLLFVFARRRVGGLVALAPCLVLLVFGSDALHALTGNGFTVVLALACGIAALLCLERGDRGGDLAACALLCLGAATYTVALGFVAAIGVYLLMRRERWRRLWIAVIPAGLYAAWWLWSLGSAINGESQVTFANILHFPSAAFVALSTVLAALTGLNYPFGGTPSDVGSVLALLAIAALAWRLRRGEVPDLLWALLALPAVSWVLISLARFRTPDEPRYLFPSAIAVLLVAAEALRPFRWTRAWIVAVYAMAVVGAATNVALMRDERGVSYLPYMTHVRAEETAMALAADHVDPAFDPADTRADATLALPFAEVRARGVPPTAAFLEAVARYGSPGFTPQALLGQEEEVRANADAILVDALDLALRTAGPAVAPKACRVATAGSGAGVSIDLPPNGVLLTAQGAGGQVAVRRFGSAAIPIGDLKSGVPAELRLPATGGPPWQLLSAATPLRICALG